jgi:transcription elongation factor Elf1
VGIKKNPYGVGYSGERVVDRTSVCPCCGAEHAWLASPEMQTQALVPPCKACEKHDFSNPDTELIALREHQQRLPALLAKAREVARTAKRSETKAVEDAKQKGRQVAAALDARDRYKEIVDAVESDPRCHAAQTIAEVRAAQRQRDWEDYR